MIICSWCCCAGDFKMVATLEPGDSSLSCNSTVQMQLKYKSKITEEEAKDQIFQKQHKGVEPKRRGISLHCDPLWMAIVNKNINYMR